MTTENSLHHLAAGKRNWFRAALALLIVLCALAIVRWGRGTSHAAASSYPREISRITFAAAGDVIPHQAVTQAASILQNQAAAETAKAPATDSSATNATNATKDAAAPVPANPHAGWDALFAPVADVFHQA